MYNVVVSKKAAKELSDLPKTAWKRISEQIDALAEEPRPDGCKKLKGEESTYRVREGDYRIVYEVSDKEITVLIIRVAHRKDVYR